MLGKPAPGLPARQALLCRARTFSCGLISRSRFSYLKNTRRRCSRLSRPQPCGRRHAAVSGTAVALFALCVQGAANWLVHPPCRRLGAPGSQTALPWSALQPPAAPGRPAVVTVWRWGPGWRPRGLIAARARPQGRARPSQTGVAGGASRGCERRAICAGKLHNALQLADLWQEHEHLPWQRNPACFGGAACLLGCQRLNPPLFRLIPLPPGPRTPQMSSAAL